MPAGNKPTTSLPAGNKPTTMNICMVALHHFTKIIIILAYVYLQTHVSLAKHMMSMLLCHRSNELVQMQIFKC
jgi:hypothetical protein